MKWLLKLLRSPSSFPADPWGYARNQMGHGYIVGGLPVLIWPPLIFPVILGYLIWEDIQITRFRSELSDSVEDAANVLTIALAVWLWQPALLLVHLLFLIAGVLKRIEEQKAQDHAPY